jgi:formylmethanofuran dehydrogenase subunit D
VQLSPKDIESLSLNEGKAVKVTTNHGSVTVYWAEDKNLDEGIVFFPYGPWANQVYASDTSSTGMPQMKGIPATIEPGKSKVESLEEIIKAFRSNS